MERGVGECSYEDGFARGREVGRVEGLAFEGVPQLGAWTMGAEFRFRRSWFDSYVDYERAVLEELRRVQWMRSIEQSRISHLEANLPTRGRTPGARRWRYPRCHGCGGGC